ncbi:MAG TPA: hypothetical protein VK831_01735 [Candidatus Deferrimicrobiaceae bacterium]|nr:hypothetical protein [Candidatus Deferrimicrobiaceae bacterium]
MHPALLLLVATRHREDLLRDAELDRRARLFRATPGTPRWRRATGRLVDVAGHALEGAARRLDPGLHGAERQLDLAH